MQQNHMTGAGRLLFVVFTHRGELVRVVTARDANVQEKRRYRHHVTGIKENRAMMGTSRDQTFTTIYHLEDIPIFATEAEEHAFWATHQLSEALWDQAEPLASGELPAPRPETPSVTIPVDEDTLARIKALARRRHKEYQALLREFVTERLDEEEQRHDISGTA